MIRKFLKKVIKNERGVALVEFAIVAPFLIFLVMGIIEFGWIFNGYIIVTGAAREGGRLAIIGEEFSVIEEAVNRHAEFFTDVQGGSINSINVKPPGDYPDPDDYPIDEMITIEVDASIPVLIGFYINGESFPLSAEVSVKRAY